MTIPATTAWGSAIGTGITGPYNIPFPLYSQSHLTVLQVSNNVPTTMALGTDYTFTAWVTDNKGQVAAPQITFTSAVAGGVGIIFLLTPPGTQLTDVTDYDAFYPAIHEIEFDLLAQKTAQLLEWAGKTIKAPDQEQSGLASLTLPPVALRKSLFCAFDSNGNFVCSSGPLAGNNFGNNLYNSEDSISAHQILNSVNPSAAGNGAPQGSCPNIDSIINVFPTVNNGDGVSLIGNFGPGDIILVRNDGLHGLKVYPPVGGQIDSLGTNNEYVIAGSGTWISFVMITSTQWYSK